MVMVVPVTSKLAALRFPHTIQVNPSSANGLTEPSVLLVLQLRALDRSRLDRAIGHLEESYLRQLDEEIRQMLGL
jgi:mRNA interferase MazF